MLAARTIFYFLRAYWKPLALLLLAMVIFNAGFSRAKRACNEANLRAEITELKRQSKATDTVLKKATKDGEARASEIENLTEKVEAYERSISKDDDCALSDADARKLRDIR